MIASTTEKKIYYAILTLFFVLGLVYSISVPIFETPDELFHYPMVQQLATKRKLPVLPTTPEAPVGPWEQEGGQPPLYYILTALLTAQIDTTDLATIRHLNPQAARGFATADGHNLNVVLHNPQLEQFPWQGTVLAIHIARFFSVLCGVSALIFSRALLYELLPHRPALILAALAVQAFTPMYLFISAAVNNDALAIPLAILNLLLLVKLLKKEAPQLSDFLILGTAAGLAILTKESALALLPLSLFALCWKTWQQYSDQRFLSNLCKRTLSWLLPLAGLAGWWYLRNLHLYGDLLGHNAFLAIVGERAHSLDLLSLWSERQSLLASYWGNFGWLNIPMPEWVYTLLNTLLLLAIAGWLGNFVRWLHATKPNCSKFWPTNWTELTAARILAALWPAALFISLLRWTSMTMASQGRLLFPALPLWSVGLLLGLISWWPQQHKFTRSLLITLPSGLLMLSLVALPAWILPSYQPPAPLRPESTIPHRLDVDFGTNLRLLGYQLPEQTVYPGETLEVTLYWEGLAPTATDQLLFIHLLGAGKRIIAQRDSAPGRGLISTTWLEPGRRWAEHYAIAIPPTAYGPDTLSLSVGVYDADSGVRLPTATGDSVHFGTAELRPRSEELQVQLGSGIRLTDYELSATTVTAGNPLTLTLHWLGTAPMQQDYTISVQLIDDQWHKAAQADSWPLEGSAPTSSWKVGQRLTEERVLNIASDASAKVYDLRLSAYHHTEEGTLKQLPISWQPHQVPVANITLTKIRVSE